jgi:hypothetical protein
VDPAALASDLDEPVDVGERAPAVGAAGADASLAQQRAERAGEARAMLGKKGSADETSEEERGGGGAAERGRGPRCSAAGASARRPAGPERMHQGVRYAGLWAA